MQAVLNSTLVVLRSTLPVAGRALEVTSSPSLVPTSPAIRELNGSILYTLLTTFVGASLSTSTLAPFLTTVERPTKSLDLPFSTAPTLLLLLLLSLLELPLLPTRSPQAVVEELSLCTASAVVKAGLAEPAVLKEHALPSTRGTVRITSLLLQL